MTPFKSFLDFIKSNPISNHSSRVIGNWDNRPRYKGTVSPSVMTYGAQTLNSQSALQTAVVTNVGAFGLPIESITSVGDWIVSNNCPAVLQPGETCQISAVFNPKRAGLHTGGIYVNTGDAAGTEFVQLIGTGSGTVVEPPIETPPSLAISDATITAGVVEPPAVVGSVMLASYPSGTAPLTSYTFVGSTEVGSTSSTVLRLVATGNITFASLPVTDSNFTITYGPLDALVTAPQTLTDGQSLRVNITFNPATSGIKNKTLTFTPTGGTAINVALGATATEEVIEPPIVSSVKDIAVFYPNYNTYDTNGGVDYQIADLPIDNIPSLKYAFFHVTAAGAVNPGDINADTQKVFTNGGTTTYGNLGELARLRAAGKTFKLALSLGDAASNLVFSTAVSTPTLRTTLVESILARLTEYPVFNAVNIDWEFPSNDGINYGAAGNAVNPADADNLVSMLTLLRSRLNETGRSTYKLSMAFTCNHNNLKFPVPALSAVLDECHLMTYDYADGAWGSTVSMHHTNLYPSGISPFSVHTTVQAYIAAGMPANKIYIGVALYSRGFANTNGMHQACSGGSIDGTFVTGVCKYKDLPIAGATEYWDSVAQASYSYDATRRVVNSYDTVQSVNAKCDYVINNGLAGIMVWEASGDTTYANSRSIFKTLYERLVSQPSTQLARISVQGNQFMRNGSTYRIKAVNWSGFETPTMCVHGMWLRSWKPMVAEIAEMGFNCVRLPFSRQGFSNPLNAPTDFGALGRGMGPGGTDLNPDWENKTVYELMDMFIDECRKNNLYVLLDHHRNNWDAQDGTPVTATYDQAGWLELWGRMASRYANNTTVIGADLYNEPVNTPWATLASLFETCGNHIHTLAPEWIIFCEGGAPDGQSDNYFWAGGNLENVRTRPVTLTLPNKLAYAPHEYGLSVYYSSWLKTDGNTPANWPLNLNVKRNKHYSYIFEEGIAPVLVGEFGGRFGYANNGTTTDRPNNWTYEQEWVNNLIDHLNGDFTGDGGNDLTAGQQGMSFAYWSFNANSSDVGGLLKEPTWTEFFQEKLDIIEPLMTTNVTPPVVSNFRGMLWQVLNDNVGVRRSWEDMGITKTMLQWVAVDDSSFIPQAALPLHIGQLNLTDIAAQPWASELVIGLAGKFTESTARANVPTLLSQSVALAALTYPANLGGFYFPVEIDPSWTDAPTALANVWSSLPRPLYISAYYGTTVTNSTQTLAAANWLNSFIPADVTLLFQDGVGAHGVAISEALRRYNELKSVLGSNRVQLIPEAFRQNPAYPATSTDMFIPATAAQFNPQLTAYATYPMWIFDGPNYLTTQLIQEVLNEVPVLPPSTLAAGKYGNNDLLLSWTRTSQGGASVSGYEVYIYESGGNTIIRTIQVTGTTTSVTYPAAQAYADAGNQVMTFVVFRVSEKSTTGFVSDKSDMFAATATDMIDPPGTYGVLMTGGQSNMDQHFGSLSQNAEGRSYQKIIDGVTTALGRSPGDITMVNGASGGSAAEYRARPSWFPTGYWWDSVAGTPGPMLTAWEAKYAALPNGTNIIGVIWAQGEADVTANSADVATSTPAMFKAALQSIFARMRTVVGNPNLKIWIQPLAISYWNYGANGLDIIGGIYEAYRDQQLAIAYEQANTHIGAWVPDITYGGFVQEYDNGTPIAGRIHYTPTNYHALGTKLGQAIGNNADQIELRPAWANLRAGTNITAQFDASNNITITWTARPGISEWHIINSKLDGSGFWSQGNVTTNSFTYTAAQQTADHGFAGVMVGFYVAEYSNSTVGSHGRFVGAPTAYSGGGGGGGG